MAYHVQSVEATYGADQTTCMCCNYYGCRTADTRICLEHPRPHALGGHCLPGLTAGEPTDHRQGKSSLGETSLVRNQWQARLKDVPVSDHSLVLFMQAARWADDIRSNDKQQQRTGTMLSERPLRLRGCSILWAISTNPYTRHNYSLLIISKVIEVGTKFV